MIITYSNDFQCVEYVLRLDLVAGSGTASWTYFYELRDVFLRNTTCGLDVFLRITSRISTKYFFYEILFLRNFKILENLTEPKEPISKSWFFNSEQALWKKSNSPGDRRGIR